MAARRSRDVSGCSPPSGREKDDAFARYSNFGAAVDIVAPGTCVRSLAPGTGTTVRTAIMSGTSMATPHVTGAVARYLADHPGADQDAVRRQLIAVGHPRLGVRHRPGPGEPSGPAAAAAASTRRP